MVALALGGGASKGFAHIGRDQGVAPKQYSDRYGDGHERGRGGGQPLCFGHEPDRLELEAEILEKAHVVDLTLSTTGFIKGQKLQDYINRKVGGRAIQDLPVKFAAVATDFSSGKMVAFNRGNTGQAVRAR